MRLYLYHEMIVTIISEIPTQGTNTNIVGHDSSQEGTTTNYADLLGKVIIMSLLAYLTE